MSKRVDGNQSAIVSALRAVGAAVQDLHEVGKGFPDVLCCWRGKLILMEIKAPGGELNEREQRWHMAWPVPVAIVHSVDEALDALGGEHDTTTA